LSRLLPLRFADAQRLECEGIPAASSSGEEPAARLLSLNMGEVQLGEVGKCSLRIRNEGALASQYLLLPLVCDVCNFTFPLSTRLENSSGLPRPHEDRPHLPSPAFSIQQAGDAEGDTEPASSTSSTSSAASSASPSSTPPFCRGGERESESRKWNASEGERRGASASRMSSSVAFSDACELPETVRMVSADTLVTSESFESGAVAASPDLSSLLNQWSYEAMNLRHLVLENARASFPPRTTTVIRFSYAPSEPGDFYALFLLKTENALIRDRLVAVRCRCMPPPISVESAQHDFGVCTFERSYSRQLSLYNSQNSAMKVWVASPSLIADGELSIEPQSSFIQARGRLTLTATFRPTVEFFNRFPQFVRELDAEIRQKHPGSLAFCILVRIEGADQVLPVETTLTGMVTRKELMLSPPSLDFGDCCEGSAVSIPLVLFNPSLLPMEYAFCRLHRDLSVFVACDADHLCSSSSVASLASAASSPFLSLSSPSSSSPSLSSFSSSASASSSGSSASPASSLPPWVASSAAAGSPSFSPAFLAELEEKQFLPQSRLSHCLRGDHGCMLPGEIRKVILVYTPNKHSPESSTFGGLKVDASGERTDSFVLRTLVGSQAATETRISWRASPAPAKVSFAPCASLRLPAVPVGESVSDAVYMRLRSPLPSNRLTEASQKSASLLSTSASLGSGASPIQLSSAFTKLRSASPGPVKREAKEAKLCGGDGHLSVQILAPPFALAALRFNPSCFVLSPTEPTQRIAVSFTPERTYMRPTLAPVSSPSTSSLADAEAPPHSPGEVKMRKEHHREKEEKKEETSGDPLAVAGSEKIREQALNERGRKALKFADELRCASKAPRDASALVGGERDAEDHRDGPEEEAMLLKQVREYGGVRWMSSLLPSPVPPNEETFATDADQAETEERALEREKQATACVHAQWLVPVRCRLSRATEEDEFFSFLQVSTCATPALVSASPAVLDFGDVTVGASARLRCKLEISEALSSANSSLFSQQSGSSASSAFAPSNTEAFLALKAEELPFSSCFELVSALRPLCPARPVTLSVAFHPRAPQSYRATLRLVGPLTRQSVELRGRGIRAEMVVSPPDRDLDFGAVFVPSQPGKGSPPHAPAALCPAWTYKVLTVRNPASSCVLRFRVECLFTSHSAVETCGARRSFAPFACWPLQGEILPGASQQFCLAFRPSKEEGLLTAVYRLTSENGSLQPHYLHLRGLAVSHQLYAIPPFSPSSFPFSASSSSSLSSSSPSFPPSRAPLPFSMSPLSGRLESPSFERPLWGLPPATRAVHETSGRLPVSSRPPGSSPENGAATASASACPRMVSSLLEALQRERETHTHNGLSLGCCRNRVFQLVFDDSEAPGENASVSRSSSRVSSPRGPCSVAGILSERGKSVDNEGESPKEKGVVGKGSSFLPAVRSRASFTRGQASTGCEAERDRTRTRLFLLGAAWGPVSASGPPPHAGKGSPVEKGDTRVHEKKEKSASSDSAAAAASAAGAALALPVTSGGSTGPPSSSLSSPASSSSLSFSSLIPSGGFVSSLTSEALPGKETPFAEGKGEPVGQFEICIEGEFPEFFSVEPSRGSLAAGAQQAVTFSFNPDAGRASSRTRTILESAGHIVSAGQWATAKARVLLKGGLAPSASSSPLQEFEIVLKGFCPGFAS
ncbi:putative flagellar associated, related protein, partial [Toxoplasma gondii TgCatPRC2]